MSVQGGQIEVGSEAQHQPGHLAAHGPQVYAGLGREDEHRFAVGVEGHAQRHGVPAAYDVPVEVVVAQSLQFGPHLGVEAGEPCLERRHRVQPRRSGHAELQLTNPEQPGVRRLNFALLQQQAVQGQGLAAQVEAQVGVIQGLEHFVPERMGQVEQGGLLRGQSACESVHAGLRDGTDGIPVITPKA
ncbi:hypothetical protein [Deinococcus sp.]|uniref:hypothetical protein n=1 Tax=Deinococcus sp. TaxID=47478 RepID=UPI003C79BBC5